jgi:hypothetical protein
LEKSNFDPSGDQTGSKSASGNDGVVMAVGLLPSTLIRKSLSSLTTANLEPSGDHAGDQKTKPGVMILI